MSKLRDEGGSSFKRTEIIQFLFTRYILCVHSLNTFNFDGFVTTGHQSDQKGSKSRSELFSQELQENYPRLFLTKERVKTSVDPDTDMWRWCHQARGLSRL